MAIEKDKKKTVIDQHKVNPKDTGSSQVQIALFSQKIQSLSDHMKKNPKDYASQRGLLKMVSHRRSLLSYLKNQDSEGYQKILQKLDLRK